MTRKDDTAYDGGPLTISYPVHEIAHNLLVNHTGSEGGFPRIDWYKLRAEISDAIALALDDQRRRDTPAPASPAIGEGSRVEPIDTAPKDGTWFIAYQDGDTYPCEWRTEEPDEGPSREGWFDHFNQSFEAPTHWQPLPHKQVPSEPVAWRAKMAHGYAHTSSRKQAEDWGGPPLVEPLFASPPSDGELVRAAKALMARWPTDQHEGSPLKAEADALRAAIFAEEEK
jgi:hypothetical protein